MCTSRPCESALMGSSRTGKASLTTSANCSMRTRARVWSIARADSRGRCCQRWSAVDHEDMPEELVEMLTTRAAEVEYEVETDVTVR